MKEENTLSPTDSQKHKQPLSKLALVSLIIAILGICAPIAWDYWKTKSDLAVHLTGKLPLFANDNSLEKLRIYYGSNEVKQLTRFNFVFENAGKTPIQERDIIVPVELSLNNGCVFIDKSVDKVEPSSVTAKVILTNENKTLQLQFPLVNPSDKISFSGLVSGTNPVISLQSRVVGVHEIRFIDESSLSRKSSIFSTKVLPNVVLGALFALLLALKATHSERRQARTALLIIESDSERLSKFTKKSDFLNYVRGRLEPYIFRSDRRQIIMEIESMVPEEGVSQEVKPQVIQAIKTPVQDTIRINTTAMKVVTICFIVGAMAGIYFLF